MVSPPARSPGCCTRNPRDSETPCAGLAPRTSGDDAHRRTHSTDSSGRANSIGRSSSWRNFCTMRNSGSSVRSGHGSASAGSKIDRAPRPSCRSMHAVCHGSSSPWQRNAQRSPSGTNSVENADRIRRGNRKLIRARSLRLRRRSAWMADTFTVQEKPLRRFCEQVLVKLGVPAEDARVTTDVLVLADLRGIDSHGVARLGRYVNGLKQGTMKSTDQSRVIREAKATALVDGGQSLGQVVGKKAMDLAIHKARDTSVGVVAVRNSNHYGIAGYYALMALEHNLIGVSMTNAGPLVVPTFGRTSILDESDQPRRARDEGEVVRPRYGDVDGASRQGRSVQPSRATDAARMGGRRDRPKLNGSGASAECPREATRRRSLASRRRRRGARRSQGIRPRAHGRRPLRRAERSRDGIASLRGREEAERGALLHGPRSDRVSAARRVPARHGSTRSRAERQSESAGPGTHLRARREELRPRGEVPQGRNPAGFESRRRSQENRNRPRHPLARLRLYGSSVRDGRPPSLRILPAERRITCRTPWGAQVEEVLETMPEEEFLGELSEKTTSVTIKEFTPDGVLISYNLQGTQKGQYDATHMETVDALFKPDGTYDFEARGIDQTDEGDMLIIKAKGTGRTISPTSVHAQGEAVYQTLSEKLKWLNTAKGRFEGTYNTSTGEFIAKVFALK